MRRLVLPNELLSLIEAGESLHVEFKKSTTDVTNDVYESICAFSNREGGHVFLGIKDDGTILGVREDKIDQILKSLAATLNNPNKMYPPLYLTPIPYEWDDKILIYIRVPLSQSVCRCSGRIYDRSHEADIDITDHENEVYRLYSRKNGSYFVNRVTHFGVDSLNSDLLARVREMTRVRRDDHPWRYFSDEELLRSAGLILTDEQSQQEGVTIAGILLFGQDNTIMSVLPQHKTDAVFRVFNLDRYDDRDVVITNLLDSYNRLMAFGRKHLNDAFHLDGIQSVSARDHILREIISNLLMHRDFSSGYVAKLVIERECLYTENASLSHGAGALDLNTFEPYQKNPPISRVFREIGLADELGSGMRNTYRYTKMYSEKEPEFIEGDIFRIVIPLLPSVVSAGGAEGNGNVLDRSNAGHNMHCTEVGDEVSAEVGDEVGAEVKLSDEQLAGLLEFCSVPRSRMEMQTFCEIKSERYFREHILTPMLRRKLLLRTIPDKPRSSRQKYVRA